MQLVEIYKHNFFFFSLFPRYDSFISNPAFHSFVFWSYVSSQILHVFPSIGLDLKRLATLLATPRHLLLPTGAFFLEIT
jgi:hypothetical protein